MSSDGTAHRPVGGGNEPPPPSGAREYDPFKDSLLRFAGYANELGEAFRSFIPRWAVAATYGVASVYAVSDACYQARLAYYSDPFMRPREAQRRDAMQQFVSTGLWQLLASVLIPPYFVNRSVTAARWALQNVAIPAGRKRWIQTGTGLVVIPIIVKPIDHMTFVIVDALIPSPRRVDQ